MSLKNELKFFELIRLLVIVVISIGVTFIVISIASDNPLFAIQKFFLGPFSSLRRFSMILEFMIPLTFVGLGISIMFRANQFNMGSEGVFYLGGLLITVLALNFKTPLFSFWAIPLVGIIGGCVTALVGYLKVKYGAVEVVSSLMLNYIILFVGLYFLNNILTDPTAGYNASKLIPEDVLLPKLWRTGRLHSGFFIAMFAVFCCDFLMNKSIYGYMLRMAGTNINFASYSGMNTAVIIVGAQFIGGFLAGIGGAIEILGLYTRFNWSAFTGYGIDGIIVSLLANRETRNVPLAAFFLAYIRTGALIMSNTSNVTVEVVAIVQATIVALIGAKSFLEFYRKKIIIKDALV